MREDNRPTDAFAWTRPWVPYGDDPFVWYDPSEDMKRDAAPQAANDGREQPRVAAEAAAPAPAAVRPRTEGGEEDIWVELPAVEDKPKRARRGRGRGRGGEASAEQAVAEAPSPIPAPEPEAIAEPAPEPVTANADAPPSGKKPRASRAKAKPAPLAEVVAEAAPEAIAPPEPAPEPEPAVVAPRKPDPAEISTPPAAPRRGWWRRG